MFVKNSTIEQILKIINKIGNNVVIFNKAAFLVTYRMPVRIVNKKNV